MLALRWHPQSLHTASPPPTSHPHCHEAVKWNRYSQRYVIKCNPDPAFWNGTRGFFHLIHMALILRRRTETRVREFTRAGKTSALYLIPWEGPFVWRRVERCVSSSCRYTWTSVFCLFICPFYVTHFLDIEQIAVNNFLKVPSYARFTLPMSLTCQHPLLSPKWGESNIASFACCSTFQKFCA